MKNIISEWLSDNKFVVLVDSEKKEYRIYENSQNFHTAPFGSLTAATVNYFMDLRPEAKYHDDLLQLYSHNQQKTELLQEIAEKTEFSAEVDALRDALLTGNNTRDAWRMFCMPKLTNQILVNCRNDKSFLDSMDYAMFQDSFFESALIPCGTIWDDDGTCYDCFRCNDWTNMFYYDLLWTLRNGKKNRKKLVMCPTCSHLFWTGANNYYECPTCAAETRRKKSRMNMRAYRDRQKK